MPNPRTWMAIDEPDAVCTAYEDLWDDTHAAHPFAGSLASAAVEAMAWDPWSHFDGTLWRSPRLDEGDREVQVEARAIVLDDEGTLPAVGRRVSSGVRVTALHGPEDPRPRVIRCGRLVLECALTVRDASGIASTRRTRVAAGSVLTVLSGSELPSSSNPGASS